MPISAATSSPTAGAARVYAWSSLPTDTPMPKISRQRIPGEHAMLASVVLEKGFYLGSHHHPNEQFAIVLEGRIRFVINEGTPAQETLTLGPGQVLVVPPNVPHSAEALERTRILDIFSPPSAGTGVDAPPAGTSIR
ncbi:MAG: cupin domain-containing protein [Phycisphaerae bacterium]|nr:cupin domain-containing protein [Phycisphaerae bacterium]